MGGSYGFTLAEILITLGIIGLIADMTIPTLISSVQDKQLKVMWRKTYSDLYNASRLMSIEKLEFTSEQQLAEEFGKYLKNTRICEANKDIEQGCWAQNKPIYRKDKVVYVVSPSKFGAGSVCVNIINGALICYDYGGINTVVYVDINGPKLPNTIGKDVFAATFNSNLFEVRPANGIRSGWGASDGKFVQTDSGDGTCNGPNADSYGWGCSTELLYN